MPPSSRIGNTPSTPSSKGPELNIKGEPRFSDSETTLKPHKIVSQGVVYRDRYKSIERITADFGGFSKEYFVTDCGVKAAAVVVRDQHILLVRQYRLLINDLSLEIPGGKVGDREAPIDAAARECLEETGVRCDSLTPLIAFSPDHECIRNPTHVFHTDIAEEIEANTDTGLWLPVSQCIEKIYDGTINDSLSVISILAYAARVLRSQ